MDLSLTDYLLRGRRTSMATCSVEAPASVTPDFRGLTEQLAGTIATAQWESLSAFCRFLSQNKEQVGDFHDLVLAISESVRAQANLIVTAWCKSTLDWKQLADLGTATPWTQVIAGEEFAPRQPLENELPPMNDGNWDELFRTIPQPDACEIDRLARELGSGDVQSTFPTAVSELAAQFSYSLVHPEICWAEGHSQRSECSLIFLAGKLTRHLPAEPIPERAELAVTTFIELANQVRTQLTYGDAYWLRRVLGSVAGCLPASPPGNLVSPAHGEQGNSSRKQEDLKRRESTTLFAASTTRAKHGHVKAKKSKRAT
ncbi:MAG: hypothetical protein U1A77_22465 [Pirellulales bacterium]